MLSKKCHENDFSEQGGKEHEEIQQYLKQDKPRMEKLYFCHKHN